MALCRLLLVANVTPPRLTAAGMMALVRMPTWMARRSSAITMGIFTAVVAVEVSTLG